MTHKKLLMLVAIIALAFNISSIYAQKLPTDMRVEVAESERDNAEYSIFIYKDKDDTFGYYLSIGRVTHVLSMIRSDITDASLDDIKETCIWLGATSDEAFATIDDMLDLYDKDLDTAVEFKGRAATGSDRLGEPNTTICVVKNKLLGGKTLQFNFPSGKREAHANLPKSVLKELRREFRIDKKLHPKQHR